MKKFYLVITSLFLILLFAAISSLGISASNEKVIFISDAGINSGGDGSSAQSPLAYRSYGIINYDANYPTYSYDSILYQACYKLANTGGTVVICGEVKLDFYKVQGNGATIRDFFFPYHPESNIKITSVYNGVDYRQTNNARLILQTPACMVSQGPLEIDNVNICTMPSNYGSATGRVIAGGGYPMTIGSGVKCIPLDINGNTIVFPTANLYPEICGGHRYSNTVAYRGTSKLTINGGTFYRAIGGNYGLTSNAYGKLTGDSSLTIGGNAEIKGNVYGTNYASGAVQFGDSYINITGGIINGTIYGVASGGYGSPNCKLYINIIGGNISVDSIYGNNSSLTNDSLKRYNPSQSIITISSTALASSLVSKLKNFTEIVLPPSYLSGVNLSSAPIKSTYFAGDYFDPSGLAINQMYLTTAYSINYSKNNTNFSFSAGVDSPLEAGTNNITIKYGSFTVANFPISVVDRPKIRAEGAMIRTDSEKQGLRFVAYMENPTVGFTIDEYGFLAVRSDSISSADELKIDGTGAAGMLTRVKSTGYAIKTDANGFYFDGLISNIPIEEYSLSYSALAYYIFTFNGKQYTAYSEIIERSVKSVAEAAVISQNESEGKKQFIQNNVISAINTGRKSTFDQNIVNNRVEMANNLMRKMSLVKWVCNDNMDFKGDSEFTSTLQYTKGITYTGIPYIAGSNGFTNIQQWLKLYPEGSTYTGETGWNTMLGNQCSSAVIRAIQPFTNSNTFSQFSVMNSLPREAHPSYTKVGPYNIDDYSLTTQAVTQSNGSTEAEREQIIYESYAESKNGDFIVSRWISSQGTLLGHIRIVSSVHVVRNSQGKIDGQNSYMITHEQCSTMDKTKYSTWRIDYKYRFNQLYNSTGTSAKYIPIRLNSYETSYFATPYLTITNANNAANISSGISGRVMSNYHIYEVILNITDAQGNSVIELSSYPFQETWTDLRLLDSNNVISSLPKGDYRYSLKISCADETVEYIAFDFKIN